MENIIGARADKKETKSQRNKCKRLERQVGQAESQREAHERAQRRRDIKKERKQAAKRKHRATKKEQRRKQRLAKPKLLSTTLNENVQRWFISGRGYKIPDVFLNDTEDDVIEVVDDVNEPKKVYTVLKCELVKHDLKTGEKIYTEFIGRSKTHTITTKLDDT